MARRRRLSAPFETESEPDTFQSEPSNVGPLETKAWGAAPSAGSQVGPQVGPPIAQVARDAATRAAMDDLLSAMTAARAEGRLVERLPLDAVAADHLMRDRIAVDDEAAATLRESLRARGQQVPVEVVDLGADVSPRYGLISGWRRLTALRALHAETGEARFGAVAAVRRRPESAAAAYVAMVEENEVRAGLSYYERARVVARSAAAGVFPTPQDALRTLFASAPRSRRSKIASFVTVHAALDGALRFPTALGERQGLALARALDADGRLGPRLRDRLRRDPPETAAAEATLLAAALAPAPSPTLDMPAGAREIAPGVYLQTAGGLLRPRYTLSGPRVGADFAAKLAAWLNPA